MKKIRSHRETPVPANTGSGSPAIGPKPKRLQAKPGVSVCMTCGVKVDWRFNPTLRVWTVWDHGADRSHRCKS